jgi:hypothetical protein
MKKRDNNMICTEKVASEDSEKEQDLILVDSVEPE